MLIHNLLLSSTCSALDPLSPVEMPKKISVKELYERARKKGAEIDTGIVNGDELLNVLQLCAENAYNRAMDLWNG